MREVEHSKCLPDWQIRSWLVRWSAAHCLGVVSWCSLAGNETGSRRNKLLLIVLLHRPYIGVSGASLLTLVTSGYKLLWLSCSWSLSTCLIILLLVATHSLLSIWQLLIFCNVAIASGGVKRLCHKLQGWRVRRKILIAERRLGANGCQWVEGKRASGDRLPCHHIDCNR